MICRDTFLLHKLKQPSIPFRCYVRTATAPTLPHIAAEVTINNYLRRGHYRAVNKTSALAFIVAISLFL